MTTLFISDLHLDDRRPEATRTFLEFLRTDAPAAEALYILGDLFEYWIGDDASTPTADAVAEALAQVSAADTPCYFAHGNRDFLVGEAFAARASMELLGEETVVDLYGEPTVLLHGDTLCTDDVEYQAIRRTLRDPGWQAQFLRRSPDERVRMAQEARELSAEHKQGVGMEIMDVNPGAVRDCFERNGVRRMIHGHTHRPGTHRHALSAGEGERIVLGDWYEQGSVLRVDDDRAHLEGLAFRQA